MAGVETTNVWSKIKIEQYLVVLDLFTKGDMGWIPEFSFIQQMLFQEVI